MYESNLTLFKKRLGCEVEHKFSDGTILIQQRREIREMMKRKIKVK